MAIACVNLIMCHECHHTLTSDVIYGLSACAVSFPPLTGLSAILERQPRQSITRLKAASVQEHRGQKRHTEDSLCHGIQEGLIV